MLLFGGEIKNFGGEISPPKGPEKKQKKTNPAYGPAKANCSGVPQGLILGPLLFIIFMNNLPAVVGSCDIRLYADDTIVYCHGKTADEVKQKLTVGF